MPMRALTETADDAHTERMLAAVRALERVEVISVRDRVMERHQGGKIQQTSPAGQGSSARSVYGRGR